MAKQGSLSGNQLGKYRLHRILGRGGNSEVYATESADGSEIAIKVLGRGSQLRASQKARYESEIEVMRKLTGSVGVIPLLDSGNDNEYLWYTMPIATPLLEADVSEFSARDIVAVAIQITETLAILAERDVFHRDIKPSNLFKLQDRWVVGDFGLAKFPGNTERITPGNKRGPLFYIAPEMLNYQPDDFHDHADVFSAAKTLWVLLTGQRYPFPGPHSREFEQAWVSKYRNDIPRSDKLDDLITRATCADGHQRLSMREFNRELGEWLNPSTAVAPALVQLHDISEKLSVEVARGKIREQSTQRMRAEVDRFVSDVRPLLQPIKESLLTLGDQFHVAYSENRILAEMYASHRDSVMGGQVVQVETKRASIIRLHSGLGVGTRDSRLVIIAGHVLEDFTGFGQRQVTVDHFSIEIDYRSLILHNEICKLVTRLLTSLRVAADEYRKLLTLRQSN